jgi:membrane protein implicated in regulation of membrane protease activity
VTQARTYEQRYNLAGVTDVDEFKSKLGKLRLVQWALIGAVLIFVRIGELIGNPGSNDWTWQHWLVTGFALWAVWGGFRFRRRMLDRSKCTLAKDASDPRAAKQWQAGQLVALAIAENIALWGLLIRVAVGGALWQASLFYGASLALLLLWTPRLPSTLPPN